MKEEDFIYSLSKIDPELIENADPSATAKSKVTPIRKGMSKVAVAAIAFACVLALSGGVVWAMNSSAIKDFFFPNSEKEFNEVYNEIGKQYTIGDYKLVLEGSVYEKAVEQGYLSFSIRDKDGKLVDADSNVLMQYSSHENYKNPTLFHHLQTISFKLGKSKCYIVNTYINAMHSYYKNTDLFIKFSRLGEDADEEGYDENKGIRFLVLNEEQWNAFKNEIDSLEENNLCTYTYDPETDKITANYDENTILPEVSAIIDKYDPCTITTVTSPTQVINIGNVKLTVGRADMLMEYNTNDCALENFVIRREDGTELQMIRKNNGAGYIWTVENPESYNTGAGAGDTDTGSFKWGFNYGFILGADEKIAIEANGETYK